MGRRELAMNGLADKYGINRYALSRTIKKHPSIPAIQIAEAMSHRARRGRHGQQVGIAAQTKVAAIFTAKGRRVKAMRYFDSYDLLVDGWKIEVKCAEARRTQDESCFWAFNLHRHGKLIEKADFYVLRMEEVPYSTNAIHLLLKSPVGSPTVNVSFRSLLNGGAMMAVEFEKFSKGEYGAKP